MYKHLDYLQKIMLSIDTFDTNRRNSRLTSQLLTTNHNVSTHTYVIYVLYY